MTQIYHNPRCAKSRETLEILKDAGEEIEIIEYLKNPPSSKDLHHILKLLKIKPLDLIRKNEPIWKEQYRSQQLSSEKLIQIMIEHPKLIERPIVIKNGKARIGRPPEFVKEIL